MQSFQRTANFVFWLAVIRLLNKSIIFFHISVIEQCIFVILYWSLVLLMYLTNSIHWTHSNSPILPFWKGFKGRLRWLWTVVDGTLQLACISLHTITASGKLDYAITDSNNRLWLSIVATDRSSLSSLSFCLVKDKVVAHSSVPTVRNLVDWRQKFHSNYVLISPFSCVWNFLDSNCKCIS